MVTDDFYVVELPYINIILGVQWISSLGNNYVDYQAMELEFRAANGSKVVLRGMTSGASRIVSTHRMERTFRHGT